MSQFPMGSPSLRCFAISLRCAEEVLNHICLWPWVMGTKQKVLVGCRRLAWTSEILPSNEQMGRQD